MEVEYKDIGQYRFAIKKRKPFSEYLESNNINKAEWNCMKQWQKENTLLMYKWGSESNNSNKSAEVTRQNLLHIFGISKLSDEHTLVYKMYLEDERHIMQIRKDFGVALSSEAKDEINKVKELFTKPLAKKMSVGDWE